MNRLRIDGDWQRAEAWPVEHPDVFDEDFLESLDCGCDRCDPLVGSIQESYGISEDEAGRLLAQSIRH